MMNVYVYRAAASAANVLTEILTIYGRMLSCEIYV